jgi:O-antigen biosynthesis protein
MEGIANRLCVLAGKLEPQPLISVIMPVYNRAGIVAEAITSVLAQSYHHFELIVVDDCNTDASTAVVKAFDDDRIRLITLPVNSGPSAARNAWLEAAQGEIIAYLDSDNAWDDRYLAAVAGAFETLPDADAVYSGILLYQNTDSSPFAVRYGHYHRALCEYLSPSPQHCPGAALSRRQDPGAVLCPLFCGLHPKRSDSPDRTAGR